MAEFSIFGGQVSLKSGSVTDDTVSSTTDIDADKLEHMYKPGSDFGFNIDDAPTGTVEKIVFRAATAGTIRKFRALLNVDGTSTSVAFDLKVNGSTVLSSVVTITDSTGDGVASEGTISSPSLSAGDIVSIEMAVSSATGATGPWAEVDIQELSA